MSTLRYLGPAAHALLACVRELPPDALAERVAALRGARDWQDFVELTLVERAEAVVARALSALPAGSVPEGRLAMLRRATLVSTFRQQRLYVRLFEALDVLRGAGHRVVLLKGAALAHVAYAGFGARPMIDVDVLLPAMEAEAAHALLQRHGWSIPPGAEHAEGFYVGHAHLAPLVDAGGASLEIHSDLFHAGHPFALDARAVLAGAVPTPVRDPRGGAATVEVPSLEHLFVHGCLHLVWSHKLGSGIVRWLTDLRALAAHPAFDWSHAADAALGARAGSCAYWAVRLGRVLGGVAVPPEVEERLRPPGSRRLHAALERHFAGHLLSRERQCPSVAVEQRLWRLAVRPGRSGHGRAVPWQRDAAYVAAEEAGAPRSSGRWLRDANGRATRVGEVASYLWRTLRGAALT